MNGHCIIVIKMYDYCRAQQIGNLLGDGRFPATGRPTDPHDISCHHDDQLGPLRSNLAVE
jgi:hypothetical protein